MDGNECLAQLIPVSHELAKLEPVLITSQLLQENGTFILGRGKLTGILDVHVSRQQVLAEYHSPAKGDPYLTITVKGGKPSYIFRNSDEAETIEVLPEKREVLYHNDLLYLLRERFAYRFEVEQPKSRGRKKSAGGGSTGGSSVNESEIIELECEKIRQKHDKQVRALKNKINTINLKLGKSLENDQNNKKQIQKLVKKVNELKASEAREKKRYNDLKAQYDTLAARSSKPPDSKKRGRPFGSGNKIKKKQKLADVSDSDSSSESVFNVFDESSAESDGIVEEGSENDELSEQQIESLSKIDSWTDRSGQTYSWVGEVYNENVIKYYKSVLIGKRLFSIGDYVCVYSPKGTDIIIGKIISLYQTPLNKRRVELQWFYNFAELTRITKQSPKAIKQLIHSKKEIFGSIVTDSNDISVLEKHCIVKHTETSSSDFATTTMWAKSASGRYFWRHFYNAQEDQLVPNPPSELVPQFVYPTEA